MGALRSALTDTTQRTSLLTSLLGGGSLDVGAAMHRVSAPPWRSGAAGLDRDGRPEAAAAREVQGARGHAGHAALEGHERRARDALAGVAQWARRRDRQPGTAPASRAASAAAGRNIWRVVGFDADGANVVAAKRAFRVTKRR